MERNGREPGVSGRSADGSSPAALPRAGWLARAAWVVVAVVALALAVFSAPSAYEYYRSVCPAAGACAGYLTPRLTPEGARALEEAGLSVHSYALLNVAIDKLGDLLWFAVGALIFLRRSDDRIALLTALFLVAFGTVSHDTTDVDALISASPAWYLPVQGVSLVGVVCAVLFFLLFPNGRFSPRWTRWLALALICYSVADGLVPDGVYAGSPVLATVAYGVFLGFVASQVGALIYRYRRVFSAEERRQTRWVVFGTTLGIIGTGIFQGPVDLRLADGGTPLLLLLSNLGFTLSFLLVPASFGVAVLRSHLFDIDLLINRTLVYGALTALLAAVYLGGVAAAQGIVEALTGQQQPSQLVVVVSTLLIAALFNPARRRIQSSIDRRFYRGKYDARKTLDAFSARLRDETDLEALAGEVLGVVEQTVRPAHASLWLRPSGTPGRRTYGGQLPR